MTRDEIMNMPAGREMDALVAEKVMGWEKGQHLGHVIFSGKVWAYDMEPEEASESYIHKEHLPYFSIDIVAAWQVVEKMKELGYPVLRLATGDSLGDSWQFQCADAWRQVSHEGDKDYFANAETAPEAICKAALMATKEE